MEWSRLLQSSMEIVTKALCGRADALQRAALVVPRADVGANAQEEEVFTYGQLAALTKRVVRAGGGGGWKSDRLLFDSFFFFFLCVLCARA